MKKKTVSPALRAMLDEFAKRMALLDQDAMEKVRERFRMAEKDPELAEDLAILDNLPWRTLEAIGRIFLPAQRGVAKGTRRPDRDAAAIKEILERIASGETQAAVIEEIAGRPSRRKGGTVESIKARLRSKVRKARKK